MAKLAVNRINDTRYASLSGIPITLPNKPLTILFDTKFNNQVPFTRLKDVVNQRPTPTRRFN